MRAAKEWDSGTAGPGRYQQGALVTYSHNHGPATCRRPKSVSPRFLFPQRRSSLSLSLALSFSSLFYSLIVLFAEQKGVRYRFWHYILALRRDERNQVVKIPKWQRTLSPHVDGVPILEDGRTHLGMSAALRSGVTPDRPPTEGALPSCGACAADAGLGPVW